MTRRKKLHNSKSASTAFPALREFFSGYLHQDFTDEYGSAAAAAQAFRSDANPSELRKLQAEWKSWREGLDGLSPEELSVQLRKLGAAWSPATISTLDAVGKILL